jgi:hypothetical protein
MAKKSLKKRIDDLFDALGRAKKPTFPEIRSELSSLGTLAQELEDGQALSEKEAAKHGGCNQYARTRAKTEAS